MLLTNLCGTMTQLILCFYNQSLCILVLGWFKRSLVLPPKEGFSYVCMSVCWGILEKTCCKILTQLSLCSQKRHFESDRNLVTRLVFFRNRKIRIKGKHKRYYFINLIEKQSMGCDKTPEFLGHLMWQTCNNWGSE